MSVLLMLAACDIRVSTEKPPLPSNAPQSSVWVGGSDGGVYVYLEKDAQSKNTYFGKVFHASGDLAYEGPMSLHPDGASPVDVSDANSYEAWDGEKLYLSGQRYLSTE